MRSRLLPIPLFALLVLAPGAAADVVHLDSGGRVVGKATRSGDEVLVDYRLRGRKGPWRVIDVFIEGVSVVQSFRAQVQEIVSSEGADHLIRIMREKNDAKESRAERS